MADYKQSIIAEFQQLLKTANTSNDPNIKWKISNYKKVISLLTRNSKPITSTEEALITLREEGMKFTTEKKLPYKSKILLNIQEIISQGYLTENKETLDDPKVKAINQLLRLPEIGPAKAEKLYQEGITCIEDLLAKPDLINRKQHIGLRHYKDLETRIPRSEMDQWNTTLIDITQHVFDTIKNETKSKNKLITMELVGSYRRGLETSGDVDFYIAVSKPNPILMKSIISSMISLGIVSEQDVVSQGIKKTMLVGKLNETSLCRHVDVFIFSESEFPFALMFATGSAEFNIRLRNYALSIGWSLSDKALRKGNSKGELPSREIFVEKINKLNIESELDIFTFLGLQYIPPDKRFPNVPLEKLT